MTVESCRPSASYRHRMAEHVATIEWETDASPEEVTKGSYSRVHRWTFDGGITVAASSSPSVVAAPWSSADAVDPEEAFVAAVASCHMLSFLYVAAKRGFAPTEYRDRAVGAMTKNERGVAWISRVVLSPTIRFAGAPPAAEELAALHEAAHHACFIANSVKTEIVVR